MVNSATHRNGQGMVMQKAEPTIEGHREFRGGPTRLLVTAGPSTGGDARLRVSIPQSDAEKALDAAWRALPMLPADVRGEVAALLTLQSMAMIGGTAAVWAGSHFFGIGFVFDVVAFGVGTYCLGSEALRAGQELTRFWNTATRANTDADMDVAAQHFARAMSILTVNAALAIFAHRAGKAGSGARAITRWSKYIEGLKFKPPRNRGALWSRLGETEAEIEHLRQLGAQRSNVSDAKLAENMARGDGRITLEMSLPKEFWELYREQFPTRTKSTDVITKSIWEQISAKWAASLEGEVVAYVDSEEVIKAINSGKPPILIKELETITNLVRSNKRITSVSFQDIWNRGSRTKTISVADWNKAVSN